MEKKRYKRELNSQGEGQRKRDSVKESCPSPCNKHSVSSSGLGPDPGIQPEGNRGGRSGHPHLDNCTANKEDSNLGRGLEPKDGREEVRRGKRTEEGRPVAI